LRNDSNTCLLVESENDQDSDCSNDEGLDDVTDEAKMIDLFELVRPPIAFTFDSILSQINQVFVLRTKPGKNISLFYIQRT